LLHDKKVIQYYDKKFLMPMTEYLPPFWKKTVGIERIKSFLPAYQEFASALQAHTEHATISLATCPVKPLICADLFLGASQLSAPKNTVICTVNDSWFTQSYFRQLMYLYGVFKALEWQQDLIYVSHYYGVWISKHGYQVPLPSNNC
jgi:apolipoprotein N-acyltransferase